MATLVPITHQVRRVSGAVVRDYKANVYLRGTGTQVQVYSDAAAALPMVQPLSPDSEGRLGGHTEAKSLDIYVTDDVNSYTEMWEPFAAQLGDWIAPSFVNGWYSWGGSFAAGGYTKTSEGIVLLRGVLRGGTTNSAMFTLPVGFRPSAYHLFPCATYDGASLQTGRCDINAAGAVLGVWGGAAGYTSIDGIAFPEGG